MTQVLENILAEPYEHKKDGSICYGHVLKRDADIGLVPSHDCDGFCTMGIIGGTPKPLDVDNLVPVNPRSLLSISIGRKDCTYVKSTQ